jgi:hypothetical protein
MQMDQISDELRTRTNHATGDGAPMGTALAESNEERNSEQGSASDQSEAVGVGARQPQSRPLAGGGGYLDNQDVFEFRPPRGSAAALGELWIHPVWHRVAAAIGLAAFLAAWRALDASYAAARTGSMIEVRLPRYSWHLRGQRNALIERMRRARVDPPRLAADVGDALGEALRPERAYRIACRPPASRHGVPWSREPWSDVVAQIGMPAFLAIWRTLDEVAVGARGEVRAKLPPYRSFLRSQRNQHVRLLAASGHDRINVTRSLRSGFGERLTPEHVQLIMEGRFGATPTRVSKKHRA